MAVIFRFGTLKLNSKVSSCNLIAYFSVDPYTRPPQKEDGAWIVGVFDQSSVMSHDGCFARLRIAHMVCNLIPPMGDISSLLTFEEVGNPITLAFSCGTIIYNF